MSLLSTSNTTFQSYDNPMGRTFAAGLLRLDGTQKELFNGLLDTLIRHQKQLAPSMDQYQVKVRQAFVAKSFSAAQLQQGWKKLAATTETRLSGETAFQMVNLWESLQPNQKQQAEKHLNTLQSAWSSTAAKSLNELKQKQSQRLNSISSKMTLNPAQKGALQTMVIDPNAVLAWQQGVRNEINTLIRQLRTPGSNVRVLQKYLLPLYSNERYLTVQLKKLETLHGKLSPEQRQQLIQAMK